MLHNGVKMCSFPFPRYKPSVYGLNVIYTYGRYGIVYIFTSLCSILYTNLLNIGTWELLIMKIQTGLSHHVLATLFGFKWKHDVVSTLRQTRGNMMKNLFSSYLGIILCSLYFKMLMLKLDLFREVFKNVFNKLL